MNCEKARANISDYVDGELSPSDSAALNRHLLGCEKCKAEVETLRKAISALEGLPSIPAPTQILESVQRHVAANPKNAPGETVVFSHGWRWAAAAAGIAALLAIALLLNQRSGSGTGGSDPQVPPMAANQHDDPDQTPGALHPSPVDDPERAGPTSPNEALGPDGRRDPGRTKPDPLANRLPNRPDFNGPAVLPLVTPVPGSGEPGATRPVPPNIYIGPRSEYKKSSGVPITYREGLLEGLTPGVRAVPGDEATASEESEPDSPHREAGRTPPNIVLRANDLDAAVSQLAGLLRANSASFSQRSVGEVTRFVAILPSSKAESLAAALSQSGAFEVAATELPRAASAKGTTLIIQIESP